MKVTIGFFILPAVIALSQIVHAQVPQTSTTPADNDQLMPLIQFEDVPITTAIRTLARQAEINYLIDPKLFPISESVPEPSVTFRLTNVSARDTLNRMLNLRQVVMIENPVTHIARITSRSQATNVVDASLLGMDTNHPVATNELLIPLIQFQDVPLDVAVENLVRQSGIKIEIDPQLGHSSDPLYGTTTLSIRWQNVTARQALVALCLNYDLVIVKDDATGGVRIKPKPGPGYK